MIISHVKIIAFQTIINHSFWIFYIGCLYNKQKNSHENGNTRFLPRVEHVFTLIHMFNTRNESSISAHPCILFSVQLGFRYSLFEKGQIAWKMPFKYI